MHHERHLSGVHEISAKKDFYSLVGNAQLLNKSLLD
jgi:hypothetical protein